MVKLTRRSLIGGGATAMAVLAGCSSNQGSQNPDNTSTADLDSSSGDSTSISESNLTESTDSNVKQSPGTFNIPGIIFTESQAKGHNEYTRQPNAEYKPTERVWYYYNINGIHYEETEDSIQTNLSIYETLEGPNGEVWGEPESEISITNEFSANVDMSNYYMYDYVAPAEEWESGTYTLTIEVIDHHKNNTIEKSGQFSIPEPPIQSDYLSGLKTKPVFPDSDGTISRTFEGEPGYIFDTEFTFEIPQGMYDYYSGKIRPYEDDFQRRYGSYVSTALDDAYISDIVDWFRDYGRDHNHSESDILNHVISFVHRLEYIDDKVGTGYNEYPKYPAETLVEQGGDCEDVGILLASLLESMGYETRLLLATEEMMEGDREGHAAVGVNGDFSGSYFEADGKKFYYIETTSTATNNEETASGKIGVDNPMNRAYVRPVDEAPLLAVNGEITQTDGDEVTVSGYVLNTSTTDTSSAMVDVKLVNQDDFIVAENSKEEISLSSYDHDNPSNSQSAFSIDLSLSSLSEEEPLKLVVDGHITDGMIPKLVTRNTSDSVSP